MLHPVNSRGATVLPPGWGTVEPAVTLHESARLLPVLEKEPLVVRDDVQDLVEQVHGVTSGFAGETNRLQQMAATHQIRTGRQHQLSAIHLVPPAKRVPSLADLHRQHLTTTQAAPRPGVLPAACCPATAAPTAP
ncbi:hypothetical protein [Streptomyces sp. NPDC018352]|uniref:hypothetical protein n=1 Tax=Streptomyces sp. NPDC018352 TaxID=3157194 RepID=UPI00340A179C